MVNSPQALNAPELGDGTMSDRSPTSTKIVRSKATGVEKKKIHIGQRRAELKKYQIPN